MASEAQQKKMETILIYETGGFITSYVVQDRASGKTLFSGNSLCVKLWCWRNGYGWPSAADING